MANKPISAFTWILLISLALLWGGSFLAVRIALDEIGVFHSVAHRVLWAAMLLWVVAILGRHSIPKSPRVWGAFLIMGLLNNAIPFSLLSWGQLHIETGLTAILNSATAIWGILVAAIVFPDERLTPTRLLGIGLGFAGVTITIGLNNLASFDPRSLGQIAIIGATISYAFAGSWARATLQGVSPVISAAGMLTSSTLIILPISWMVEGPLPLTLRAETWVAISYYAIASTAIAYLLYYRILGLAGAGNLMLVTLLVAPVAVVLGAAVRAESLSANVYWGFALLAIGLLILDGRLGHAFRKSPSS